MVTVRRIGNAATNARYCGSMQILLAPKRQPMSKHMHEQTEVFEPRLRKWALQALRDKLELSMKSDVRWPFNRRINLPPALPGATPGGHQQPYHAPRAAAAAPTEKRLRWNIRPGVTTIPNECNYVQVVMFVLAPPHRGATMTT